jgi:hypothetical protein
MPTVPDDLTPSTEDLLGDARVRVETLPAMEISPEQFDAELCEAFGYDASPTDADIDAMYIAHMEAINEPPCVFAPFDYAPLPEVRPITSTVRKIDLSKFTGAEAL